MAHPLAGRKQSPEHIANRVAAMTKVGGYERARERMRGNTFSKGIQISQATKDKMAMATRGKRYALGCTRSIEFRKKLSEYWAKNREKHNHFIDGNFRLRQADRRRLEYRLWREAVFERDNYTCIWCGTRGGRLNADHIQEFAKYPELRFDLENGRTLCKPCHLKRHKK